MDTKSSADSDVIMNPEPLLRYDNNTSVVLWTIFGVLGVIIFGVAEGLFMVEKKKQMQRIDQEAI